GHPVTRRRPELRARPRSAKPAKPAKPNPNRSTTKVPPNVAGASLVNESPEIGSFSRATSRSGPAAFAQVSYCLTSANDGRARDTDARERTPAGQTATQAGSAFRSLTAR